jgi:hypothetical protein
MGLVTFNDFTHDKPELIEITIYAYNLLLELTAWLPQAKLVPLIRNIVEWGILLCAAFIQVLKVDSNAYTHNESELTEISITIYNFYSS